MGGEGVGRGRVGEGVRGGKVLSIRGEGGSDPLIFLEGRQWVGGGGGERE